MAIDKRWIVKEPGNPALVRQLASDLGVDHSLANLLVQRNIKTFEEAKTFFRPQLENLYDPYLMKDMDKAVERLDRAVKEGEKILVYGDYDVDGTTQWPLCILFFAGRPPWYLTIFQTVIQKVTAFLILGLMPLQKTDAP